MSLETQRQIRENVEEAQDYLRDLRQWQTTMKDRPIPPSSSLAPPPRTAVDDLTSHDDSSLKEAEELRIQGNAFFKTGDFNKAVLLYTQSLDAVRTCAGFANRAMAYLKLGENAEAEADCDAALSFDAVNLKAYQRRSLARHRRGHLRGALDDAEVALRLQPTSDVLRSTFEQLLKATLDAEQLTLPKTIDRLNVEMDPPLQTIDVPIGTSGSSFDAVARIRSKTSTKRQATVPVEKEAAGKLAKEERTTNDPSPPATAHVLEIPTVDKKSEKEAIGKLSTESVPEMCPVLSKEATRKPSMDERKIPEGSSSMSTSTEPSDDLPTSYPIPKTWAAFEAGYKSLKHRPGAFGKYLSNLDPHGLPDLFKSALTAPILTAILDAVLHDLTEGTAGYWVKFLEALKTVPRYEMLRMCLAAKAKIALKQKWTSKSEALPSDVRTQLMAFFNR